MAEGGRGHAAVTGVERPRTAGPAVAGAGVEGRVPVKGGAGSPDGPVGGGGGGHGAAAACLAAPREAGALVAGTGGGGRARAEGETGSPVRLVRGQWWTWGGGGERAAPWGSGSGGSGARGGRGGDLGSRSGASRWFGRGGGVWSVSAGTGCALQGRSGSAAVCGTGPCRSSWASLELSAGPGGPRVALPGTWGGGGSPPPPIDPPPRGAAAAAAGGTGRVTVPGEVGPGGPLWRGRGGRGDTVPGTGGGGTWW